MFNTHEGPIIVWGTDINASTASTDYSNYSDTAVITFTSTRYVDPDPNDLKRWARQQQLLMHRNELKRMLFESFNKVEIRNLTYIKKKYTRKTLRCNRHGLGLRIRCK